MHGEDDAVLFKRLRPPTLCRQGLAQPQSRGHGLEQERLRLKKRLEIANRLVPLTVAKFDLAERIVRARCARDGAAQVLDRLRRPSDLLQLRPEDMLADA